MPELGAWDGFYVIVGSAAGALVGLQFVVMTLLAERPARDAATASAAFGTPTTVHFSAALFLSALLHAPWRTIAFAAAGWGVLGLAGVLYAGITARRMRRQRVYKPVLEDWLFYFALPLGAYAMLAVSWFAAASHAREALFGVGGAALLLLFTGIHNAWDSITHIVTTGHPEGPARQSEKRLEAIEGEPHTRSKSKNR
jgi:hypothetical protein